MSLADRPTPRKSVASRARRAERRRSDRRAIRPRYASLNGLARHSATASLRFPLVPLVSRESHAGTVRSTAAGVARRRRHPRCDTSPSDRAASRPCRSRFQTNRVSGTPRTAGTGRPMNARDVTNDPTPAPSSNHVTASPPWPARPMALRAFIDIVDDAGAGPLAAKFVGERRRHRSPCALAKLRGDARRSPAATGRRPCTRCVRRDSRSHQVSATMPCVRGRSRCRW